MIASATATTKKASASQCFRVLLAAFYQCRLVESKMLEFNPFRFSFCITLFDLNWFINDAKPPAD